MQNRHDLIEGLVEDAMSTLHHDGEGISTGEVDAYERSVLRRKFGDRLGALTSAMPATAIGRNQIVTPAQLPGRDEHTLERLDDAEARDYAGPPVEIAAYKRPADKRVKTLLDDAARNRAADELRNDPAPRKLFSDPRLAPDYKPPKKPTR